MKVFRIYTDAYMTDFYNNIVYTETEEKAKNIVINKYKNFYNNDNIHIIEVEEMEEGIIHRDHYYY